MSSGFVSGGTTDAPVERSDEWMKAQQEIEANRRRKAEESRQQGGRSLFETLEANKVAKQEAFEQANKLKNQFRALDADEAEFLDSVLESTRAEELRIKQETAKGLEVFRKLQEETDKRLLATHEGNAASPVEDEEEEWIAGPGKGKRKRKGKGEKEGFKGVKIRRSSTNGSTGAPHGDPESLHGVEKASLKRAQVAVHAVPTKLDTKSAGSAPQPKEKTSAEPAAKVKSGLVDYGSDSDDE